MPGLRKISRQVINAIRSSGKPVTYKELSDLVTDRNYDGILSEVDKRTGDISMEAYMADGRVSEDMQMAQTRAIENYRRRIYDSWSVLRAAGIITPYDSKRFQYNSCVIEGDINETTNVRARSAMTP